ncbi:glycosyltransferase family 2 protein [Helicobacter himalayensis]|uniref:glycosyltransferase family 2 protein n=1 Tax=Helicobacter himalayensis TaxID=1591088 RepID=UPI003D6F629C
MPQNPPKLFILLPCYNEEEVLPKTYEMLSQKLSVLIQRGLIARDSSMVFVDDGSKDRTWEVLKNLAKPTQITDSKTLHFAPPPPINATYKPKITALKLSANKGHQNALLCAMEYAKDKCDCAISIDCDLQDDIEAIDEFIAHFMQGAEVVYGVRQSRQKDSFFKRNTALFFYKLMQTMGVNIIYNHADYRLLSNRALGALLEFKEVNLFLRGMVPLIGFKSAQVHYDRNEREAGVSKYPLRKMLSLAWNGITSFSVMPLRMVSALGLVFFVLSIALSFFALYVKLFTNNAVYGWASMLIPLSFFSGVQLLSLGVIGEYIGKIYIESKHRPRFFVAEEVSGEI